MSGAEVARIGMSLWCLGIFSGAFLGALDRCSWRWKSLEMLLPPWLKISSDELLLYDGLCDG